MNSENISHFLTSRIRGTIGPKLANVSLENQRPCSSQEFLSWLQNNQDQLKSTCYFLEGLIDLRLGHRFTLPHVSGPIIDSQFYNSNSEIGVVDLDGPRQAFFSKADAQKTAENMNDQLYSINYYLIDIKTRKT